MRRFSLLWIVVFTSFCLAAASKAQEQKPVTDVAVEGYAYSPRQLEFSPDFASALQAPDGFEVTLFASGLGGPRMLAPAPGGVYVTRPDSGDVLWLRDGDGVGSSDPPIKVVTGLQDVHGITIHEGQMFLATIREVYVADLDSAGSAGSPRRIIDDLPDGGQHPNRTMAVGPDGMLYISVGSTCNSCDEPNPEHATLLRSTLDGSERTIYASGLRNLIGWQWHPLTGQLWGMDHGSDWRGNDVPPEELNRIEQGGHYGWPWCFADQKVDPVELSSPPGTTKEAFCPTTVASILTYTAHSAPIGWVFYTAENFPEAYRNDVFIAMRGSWNRRPPSGYRVVRVQFDEQGQPVGFEDFLTGFLTDDETAFRARIAGITVTADGALLVSDDTNGAIYRIAYSGP